MKRVDTDVEKAAGNAFTFYCILVIPFALFLAWLLRGDPNMSLDSDGLPIITQVATFFSYLVPMIIGFTLILWAIFGISLLYYRLRRLCSSSSG
jgi:uncharacterized membrane-anchored protein